MLGKLLFAAVMLFFADAAAADIPQCPELESRDLYQIRGNEDFSKLVVGKDSWLFRSKTDLKQHFTIDNHTKESLRRFASALKAEEITLIMVPVPTRGITDGYRLTTGYDIARARQSYEAMINEIRKAGILVPDMTRLPGNFFWKDDYHWNANGAELVAGRIADLLSGHELLKDIETVDFETTSFSGQGMKRHVYREFYNKNCPYKIEENQDYQFFSTSEKGSDEQALFGDKKAPMIVLVGTSNSTAPGPSYANFEGFLKQKTSRDIMNVSIPGGGFDGAISHYLLSDGYRYHKPKIIIWEVNASNNFNKPDFYRSAIPAVNGGCDQVMARSEGSLAAKTILFDRLDPHKNIPAGSYLSLSLDNKKIRSFNLRLEYSQGISEVVNIHRPARVFPENNGQYYSEIPVKASRLEGLILEGAEGSGRFQAKICQGQVQEKPLSKISERKFSFTMPSFFKYIIQSSPPSYQKQHIQSPQLTISDLEKRVLPSRSGTVEPITAYWKDFAKFQNIENQADIFVVNSGVLTIDDLIAKNIALKKNSYYLMVNPVLIAPGAGLIIKNTDKPLYLSQDRGVYIASYGQLVVQNSQIAGWNEKHQSLAVLDQWQRNFRPFIFMGTGAQLLAGQSVFKNLGYDYKRSYGLSFVDSLSLRQSRRDDLGSARPPTGFMMDNQFEDLYTAIYSKGGSNMVLSRNTVMASEKNGVEFSETHHSVFSQNNIQRSKRSGLVVGKNAANNIIEGNFSAFNDENGISISSGDNAIVDNFFENNGQSGIKVNTQNAVRIDGGGSFANKKYAFQADNQVSLTLIGMKAEGNVGLIKASDIKNLTISNMDLSQAAISAKWLSGDIATSEDELRNIVKQPKKISFSIVSRY